jgi:sulfonate dioxygenase
MSRQIASTALMAPVASIQNQTTNGNGVVHKPLLSKPISVFYSPSTTGLETDDSEYKYAKYKVLCRKASLFDRFTDIAFMRQPTFPDIHYEPLTEFKVVDRGLSADPTKKSLLSAATKVTDLTPVIGTELLGIDLRQLSNSQKDELCVTLDYEQ